MHRVHLIGQGAIGSLIAAKALQANLPVSSEVRRLDSATQQVIERDGSALALPAPELGPANITDGTLVLAPVKAYHVEAVLDSVVPRLGPHSALVLMNNGMLDHTMLQPYVDRATVFLCTTSYAAKKQGKTVYITGHGTTVYGPAMSNNTLDTEAISNITALLSDLLAPVEFTPEIASVLWKKLAVNCVINPLSAIHQAKNGQLAAAQFSHIKHALIEQFLAVANGCGIQLDPTDITNTVETVIAQTANNHSSMYQDIAYQRPTEIDYINGFIVAQGKKKGIDVSAHTLMLDGIRQLTKR